MLKFRKVLRVLAWAALGGSVVLFLSLLTIYYVLRTPSMQERILQSIREPLAAAGLQTEIQSLSIDLLGGVSLDGLALTIARAPLVSGEVKLRTLRLRYRFWPLLSRRLEIGELAVEGISGRLRVELPSSKEERPSEPLDVKALLDQIRRPPLTLDSPELHLRDLNLELTLVKDPLEAKISLKSADISLAAQIQPGRIALACDGRLPLQIALASPERIDLRTGLALGFDPRFDLTLEGERLKWALDWPQLDLRLQDLDLKQTSPQGSLALRLPAFAFAQKLQLAHEIDLPADPRIDHLLWPLTLDTKQSVDSKALQLENQARAPGQRPQVKLPAPAAPLRIEGQLTLANEMKATLPSLEALDQAAWGIDALLAWKGIKAEQGSQKLLVGPALSLSLSGEGEAGKGMLKSQLKGEALRSSFVLQPIDLRQDLEASLDLAERQLHLDLHESINGFKWLMLNLKLKDPNDRELSAALDVKLQTAPELSRLHAGAAALPKIGYPTLQLQQSMTIKHPMPLKDLQSSDLDKLTITNFLSADIKQTQTGTETLARFRALHLKEEASWLASELKANLEVTIDALHHASLLRPADLLQTLTLRGSGGKLLKGSLKAATRLNGADLLAIDADLDDQPSHAKITSQILLTARPELQRELDALKVLSDTGPIQFKSSQSVDIEHGASSLRELSGFDLKKMTITAQLEQIIQALAPQAPRKYRLTKPIQVLSQAKLVKGRGELNTKLFAPALGAQDLAQARDVRLGIIANLSDLETMAAAEAKVVLQVAAVDLEGELAKKPELKGLLKQIQVILHATLENKELLRIKNLFASLQHPLLQFRGQGDLALSGRGDFKGNLDVTMPEEARAGLKGKGRFHLPLQVTLYDKQKVSLVAEPRFQDFSLTFGDLSIDGMQGSLQIHEELALDQKGKIGFLYLNTQNPFVRVDYESVEPYVGNSSILSIEKLRFKHVEAGPVVANFDVRQNLVHLNDFKADLLGGSALGRFYFDLHPERLQLGFLGRFSGLQPELLKPSAQRRGSDVAVLSGRMGSSFDVRQRLASGRIDITSIGRQQLTSLLDVLDPEYKDSQIGTARRALQVAYPRFVAIAMNQGLLDLTIGLGGLVSKDVYIRSIPLSALINAQLGTVLQKVETLVKEGES